MSVSQPFYYWDSGIIVLHQYLKKLYKEIKYNSTNTQTQATGHHSPFCVLLFASHLLWSSGPLSCHTPHLSQTDLSRPHIDKDYTPSIHQASFHVLLQIVILQFSTVVYFHIVAATHY